MSWNKTISKLVEDPSFNALPYVDKFAIAHKFEDENAFNLWPMRFYSVDEAKAWIRKNEPDSASRSMEWVVVKMEF